MLNRRDTYVRILTFKYTYFIFRIPIKSNDVTLVKKKAFLTREFFIRIFSD